MNNVGRLRLVPLALYKQVTFCVLRSAFFLLIVFFVFVKSRV